MAKFLKLQQYLIDKNLEYIDYDMTLNLAPLYTMNPKLKTGILVKLINTANRQITCRQAKHNHSLRKLGKNICTYLSHDEFLLQRS